MSKPLHKITFSEDRGHLLANYVELSKNRRTLKVIIGECDCYKNTCECQTKMNIPIWIVENFQEGNYVQAEGELQYPRKWVW
jgi:hypothetical protein